MTIDSATLDRWRETLNHALDSYTTMGEGATRPLVNGGARETLAALSYELRTAWLDAVRAETAEATSEREDLAKAVALAVDLDGRGAER